MPVPPRSSVAPRDYTCEAELLSSVAFSGPNKKVLYGKGAGMKGLDGKEYRTPDGVRNNAKAIYKIDMIAQGYLDRAK